MSRHRLLVTVRCHERQYRGAGAWTGSGGTAFVCSTSIPYILIKCVPRADRSGERECEHLKVAGAGWGCVYVTE